jgi:ArsR family transcriptional regulator, cadmium/lead-responsive transcriptional repressor
MIGAWSVDRSGMRVAATPMSVVARRIALLRMMNAPIEMEREHAHHGVAPGPEILAKYFRAFGDATLRILDLLIEREHSVSELVELLGTSQPQVSNHLACLRWCGFVATRREHRVVYYRLADERISTIVAMADELLEQNAEHVACCWRIDPSDARRKG